MKGALHMSLKEPGCRLSLLLLFLCVLLVTCFVIFQQVSLQVSLLASFVLYFWGIYTLGAAMWYFSFGLKKLWEARKHGERLLW